MTRAVSQAAITRALKALKAVGERIASVDPQPDGSCRILTDTGKEVALSPLEAWRRDNGRHAA